MKTILYFIFPLKKKFYLLLALGYLLPGNILAQPDCDEFVDSVIVKKTFPLLAFIKEDPVVLELLRKDKNFENCAAIQNKRTGIALKECTDVSCYATAFQWQPAEIDAIANDFIRLYLYHMELKDLVYRLKVAGYYYACQTDSDTAFLRTVWKRTAVGLNQAIDIYIKGIKPFYAAIDAISFAEGDHDFRKTIQSKLSNEHKSAQEKAFFELPLNLALEAMRLNGRDEAARYEPLNKGMNESAFKNLPNINWDNYKYSAILIPGQGPEEQGVIIDPLSITRCKLAVESYHQGMAPVIIVSGGHVHPNKTPYSEAVEMKKYLIKELGIPEYAIFIEPHARHTTTNLRNAARMIYRFNIPDNKKILITTNSSQNDLILGMDKRCMYELGYVPYKDLKKLSDESCEFYPVKEALQCNPKDPLDP